MLPDFDPIICPGSYMPADYEAGDPFPGPAPTPSGNVNLSTFNGGTANGTWELYIVDDAGADVGDLGDWSLNVSAGGPPPPPPPPPPPGWQTRAPMPADFYGGAMSSSASDAYIFGGYSFTTGLTMGELYKFDPAANAWSTLAEGTPPAIMAMAVYYPPTNKLYVFGGEDAVSAVNYDTTRIYDVASNTWSTGAAMPDVRSFAMSGYNPGNGKIYVASGYNTGTVDSAQPTTWEYDPVANSWANKAPIPHPVGGAGQAIINGHLYVAGGRDASNTVINDCQDYNIAADSWSTCASLPAPNNVPGSGVSAGKFYEFGGGNPFLRQGRMKDALLSPDTTGVTVAYDPAANTWSSAPSLNQARSFPGGTNVGDTLVAAGGYTGATTTNSTETMTPGGPPPPPPPPPPPGDWTAASPYPLNNVRYAFGQNGETMYVVGGVADGTRVTDTNKYDATTDTWSPLAPIPVASEAPAGAYLDGKLYVIEGDTGDSFNIYDIASNTWSSGAPRPGFGDNYGAAAGAFNGKVYVVGGGSATLGSSTTSVYDVASNSWTTGNPAPQAFFLAGYQTVGQYLYVVGGFNPSPPTNGTMTMRLDMATGSWSTGPTFTPGRADFGLAAFGSKIYALGGDAQGGGFFDSVSTVDELDTSAWPSGTWVASPPNLPAPPRQANQAGFHSTAFTGGEIWSTGGINGQTFQFLSDHLYRTVTGDHHRHLRHRHLRHRHLRLRHHHLRHLRRHHLRHRHLRHRHRHLRHRLRHLRRHHHRHHHLRHRHHRLRHHRHRHLRLRHLRLRRSAAASHACSACGSEQRSGRSGQGTARSAGSGALARGAPSGDASSASRRGQARSGGAASRSTWWLAGAGARPLTPNNEPKRAPASSGRPFFFAETLKEVATSCKNLN